MTTRLERWISRVWQNIKQHKLCYLWLHFAMFLQIVTPKMHPKIKALKSSEKIKKQAYY